MKPRISRFLFAQLIVCSCLFSTAQAVNPPPDGDYPGGNTAEGQNALFSLTTGAYNTAVGFLSLTTNATNNFNTAIGAGALLANTGDQNTATGAGALLSNTTGTNNTANGAFALFSNITGNQNNAVGHEALSSHVAQDFNNAFGAFALQFDQTGISNNAFGGSALLYNTTGSYNIAIGRSALANNMTGNYNIAIGDNAGYYINGNNNIYIGAQVLGDVEDNTIHIGDNSNPNFAMQACFIGGVANNVVVAGTPVYVYTNGQLGVQVSSKRFKEDIKPMDGVSKSILALRPVTFRYKKDVDGRQQFGLVAEEVAAVNPDLVVRDKEGKPYSVRYDQVNAMLLNEFLKEHRKVEEQGAIIAKQQKQIKALAAGLQRVSDQLELSKRAPQTVLNNQ